MSLTIKEKRKMTVDADVERRVRAFEVQLAEWSAAERPGVPVFALPGTNPDPGTCVSCGEPRGQELRCPPCIQATDTVPVSYREPPAWTPEDVASYMGWKIVPYQGSLEELYAKYNRKYFDGQLRQVKTFSVFPEREEPRREGKIGMYCRGLNSIFVSIAEPEPVEWILLHEMVHAAVPDDQGHGPRFRAELQRIAESGPEVGTWAEHEVRMAESATEFGYSWAAYEVWRIAGISGWDDGWIGEESGRWQCYRGEHDEENEDCPCSGCLRSRPPLRFLAKPVGRVPTA